MTATRCQPGIFSDLLGLLFKAQLYPMSCLLVTENSPYFFPYLDRKIVGFSILSVGYTPRPTCNLALQLSNLYVPKCLSPSLLEVP